MVIGGIDRQPLDLGREDVPHDAQDEVEILMNHGGRRGGLGLLLDAGPEAGEEADVVVDLSLGHSLAGRADDEPALGRALGFDDRPQPVALGRVLDPARDADVARARHADEIAAGKRDVRSDAGPLGAHRLLGHLDEDLLALLDPFLDGPELRGGGRYHLGGVHLSLLGERGGQLLLPGDVRGVQEGGLVEADVDERRLHPRQHADDLPLVDVAGDAALAATLDVQLDERRVLEERYPCLPGDHVDQEVLAHRRR